MEEYRANSPPPSNLPPQNVDAEASLLGSILLDSDALVKVADVVTDSDFYDPRHQYIFQAIIALFEARKPIDVLTLSNQLRENGQLEQVGGSSYLTDLTNMVPTASHAAHYAEIVSQKATRRRLIKASEEINRLGYQEDKPLTGLLETAEQQLFSVSQKFVKQDLTSVEAILSESFDRLDDLHRDKSALRGVPTGFKSMDNVLAGLQPSDLIILAARPSMGKSTLAMNIAHNVATKGNQAVLVFSLEMSKEQLVDRLLAAEAGIDAWNIRTGNLSDQDFEKLGQAMGTLSEAQIFIDDTPGISVLEMRTKARREQHQRPLGLIVVDYLQLMTGSVTSGDNRVQEISEISRGLKALARELNVPVIALSQLSRSVESRSPQIPQLADLRESGSIEQDADVVMFIYREDYYNPETDRQHITDLLIKKHRNGPTRDIELYFHPDLLQFRDIDRQRSSDQVPADVFEAQPTV